jgi:maltose-binding protein MalE
VREAAITTTTETTTATTAATITTPAVTTTVGAEERRLLIWADETRTPVIQEIATALSDATDVIVTVETKELGAIRDEMGISGPAGEGADIFVGIHGWTGQLVADGVADPVDLAGAADAFEQVALDSFSFDGALYAVPYAAEAIALYYNTDVVPEPPATFEEILDICAALDGIQNCVGVPGGGDRPDPYHNYPFLSALGGYIFAYYSETGYDLNDVGIDSQSSVAGIQFLQEQLEAGVIGGVDGDEAKAMFLDGTEPFFLSGRWNLNEFSAQDTVSWSVARIPTIRGNAPAPLVDAQGFFLSAFSENKVVARSFLVDYLTTQRAQQALYDADPRSPVHSAVLAGLADDPIASTFAASAADGTPIPNIPLMGAVWNPLGEQILLVRNGQLDASAAMSAAAEAVRLAVAAEPGP